MLDLVIILGGMVYAALQARQEIGAKTTPALISQSEAETDLEVAAQSSMTELSSTNFQDAYQDEADHYCKVASLATGISLISIVFVPAGIVALSLLTYMAIPVFKNAYTSIFVEHKPRSSVIKSIGMAAGLLAGLSFLAAVASLIYFASFRVAQHTEQRVRRRVTSSFAKVPDTVWVLYGETEVEVPFATIQAGDVVVLNAGELIPLGGKVVRGTADVNSPTLTRISETQQFGVGDTVLASSRIVSGQLFVQVSQTGAAAQAAIMARLLDQTANLKSSVKNSAVQVSDGLAGPSLIAGSVAGIVLGPVNGIAMAGCNMTDINLLTAPLGTLNFLEVGLDQGAVIKGGHCLEHLRDVDMVLFDCCILASGASVDSPLRAELSGVIQQLRARNLEIAVISDDDASSNRTRADALGIDHFYTGATSTERAHIIDGLCQQGHSICFVGTDIASAFARHDGIVSIAIRPVGMATPEAADIVLLDGTLIQLEPLFALSDELHRSQKYDRYASTIPGIAGAAGIIFLGFGLPAAFTLYVVGLGAGVGNAMWPKVSRRFLDVLNKPVSLK